jgi:hypothetical protein
MAVLASVVVFALWASETPDRPGTVYHRRGSWMNLVPADERYLVWLVIAAFFGILLVFFIRRVVWYPDLLVIGDDGISTLERTPKRGEWRLLKGVVVKPEGRYSRGVYLEFLPPNAGEKPARIRVPVKDTYGQDLLDDIERRCHQVGNDRFEFSDEVRRLAPQVRLSPKGD